MKFKAVRVLAVLLLSTVLCGAASVAVSGAQTLLSATFDNANLLVPRLVFTFSSSVPTYRILSNGTNAVSVILVNTVRGSATPSSLHGNSFVSDVSINPLGDSLEIVIHSTGNLLVAVGPGSGQTLNLTATQAPPSQATLFPAALMGTPAPTVSLSDPVEVVLLQYADVSEVVGVLVAGQQIASNDTFNPQQQNFGSSGLTSGGVPTSATQPQNVTSVLGGALGASNSQGQQITPNIAVDRRLNAIVLHGNPTMIAELKAEIAQIDIPLDSVVLETEVVELDDTSAHNLGIDFTSANGQVAAITYQTKSQSLASGSATLQAAVYAEVTNGHGKLLARPRIVAQNGASAQIITGQALPIVTSIAVSGVNAVSQQVQYVNVGVSLQIQPRITQDGFVTSHVYAEVSSVTGTQQGYPTLSQREATTSATVRDGESYVIGGLLQEDDIRSLGKTPLLGDLPLLGGLFRVRNDSYSLTNLYIIVTPHIIRARSNPPPADVPK